MSGKNPPKWETYQKYAVKKLGGTHGPTTGASRPDGVRRVPYDSFNLFPKDNIEVKRLAKPMNSSQVKAEIAKGRNIIISKSGFTNDAVSYVRNYNTFRLSPVKLGHGPTRRVD